MSDTSNAGTEPTIAPTTQPRLYRSKAERVLAGVCGGLADYFAVDPVWFRIGFVVLGLTGGSGLLIYLVMWLVVPEAPEGYQPAPRAGGAPLPAAAMIGVILVAVGGIALLNMIIPRAGRFMWPLALVVLGLVFLLGGISRDRD